MEGKEDGGMEGDGNRERRRGKGGGAEEESVKKEQLGVPLAPERHSCICREASTRPRGEPREKK